MADETRKPIKLKVFCKQYAVPYATARDRVRRGVLPVYSFPGSRLLYVKPDEIDGLLTRKAPRQR